MSYLVLILIRELYELNSLGTNRAGIGLSIFYSLNKGFPMQLSEQGILRVDSMTSSRV